MDYKYKVFVAATLSLGSVYLGFQLLDSTRDDITVTPIQPIYINTRLIGLRPFESKTRTIEQVALPKMLETHSRWDTTDSSVNSLLRFGPVKVNKVIVEDVVKAAHSVHVHPALLMAIAEKESNFSTKVKAKTSSATGLFQFIDRTWLTAIRKFGPRHGYTIGDSLSGKNKARLLSLRNDPFLSAVFAAEMLKHDGTELANKIGRPLTAGETYLIHFLGSDDAELFMKTMLTSPSKSAADLLPQPARANKPIFFAHGKNGTKDKSVAEVHDAFEAMIGSRFKRYVRVTDKLPQGVTAYTE